MVAIRKSIVDGVSWSGTFSGLVVGLVTYLALTMLGVAIGGEAFTPQATNELALGALVWFGVSAAVGAFVGGYAGARATPGITTRRAGGYIGMLTGMLLLLLVTAFVVNTALTGIRAIFGVSAKVVETVGETAGSAVGGLDDQVQGIFGNLDRQSVERLVAESSPELNQTQVSAVTNAVNSILADAQKRVVSSLSRPAEIDNAARAALDNVSRELSAARFTGRLEQQGLSTEQAQRVSAALERRITEFRADAEQALTNLRVRINELSRDVSEAVATGAWSWLVVAAIIIGLSTLGGVQGTDEEDLRDALEDDRERMERDEVRVHH